MEHIQNPIISLNPQIKLPKLPEITPLTHWLSGEAAFIGMKEAVNKLAGLVPEDHDVLIQAFNNTVTRVEYIEPHTLLLSGFNNEGNDTFVVAHYSQLVAHVVYLPKHGSKRVITGFATRKENVS